MIDNNDRHINYLRVSITDRCNLRCVYCMPKEGVSAIGHNDILTYEEILRVIKTAVQTGIVKVRVTGGEPLVRRGVVGFLNSLKTINGLKDISLTTNGILLENFAEGLFNAGIQRINVSLDSLNPEKYASITRGGNLKTVLRGIDKVEKTGFSPIKINVVVIKGANEDEVLDFAKLSIEKPYQVRFIELMPVGEAGADNNDKHLSNDSVMEKIKKHHILEPVSGLRNKTDGPARIYRIQGGKGEIGFISPVSHHFCESCNRLRLTADGYLRACLLSDEELDLKDPLRSGCNDSELEDLIKTIIAKKPTRYDIAISDKIHFKKCVRDMHSIGG
jgi:cyclic pyranopterin phosphate synthase